MVTHTISDEQVGMIRQKLTNLCTHEDLIMLAANESPPDLRSIATAVGRIQGSRCVISGILEAITPRPEFDSHHYDVVGFFSIGGEDLLPTWRDVKFQIREIDNSLEDKRYSEAASRLDEVIADLCAIRQLCEERRT